MNLEACLNEFFDYLISERDASPYTIAGYKSDFKYFFDFLSRESIPLLTETITTPDIRRYLTYIKAEKNYSVGSIRRKIHSLKSFYNFLLSQEYIHKSPMMPIKAPKDVDKVPIYMQPEEIISLIQAPTRHGGENALRDRCVIETLAFSGIRRSELCLLDWDWVCFKNYTIKVKGKGKKERIIPISEPLVSDLWAYLNSRLPLTEHAVFTWFEGGRIAPRTVNRMFNKYIKLAGLEGKGYTPHKLRHSYATLLLQNGADLIAIKELLGHEDLNSTKVYTKTDMKHLRTQAQKFPLTLNSQQKEDDVCDL